MLGSGSFIVFPRSEKMVATLNGDLSYNYQLFYHDAVELAKLLKGACRGTDAPIHVNLIRVNAVKETGFSEGSVEEANKFAKALESYGIVATVRRRLGADVNAACGQLRRSCTNS